MKRGKIFFKSNKTGKYPVGNGIYQLSVRFRWILMDKRDCRLTIVFRKVIIDHFGFAFRFSCFWSSYFPCIGESFKIAAFQATNLDNRTPFRRFR
jgi:hypothetical protein